MPIHIGAQQEETRTVTVEYGGETAEITFYPKRMTKRLVTHVQKNQTDLDVMTEALSQLLKEWDVVGSDGERLPTTTEVMEDFPLEFLSVVFRALDREAAPGEGGAARLSTT